MGCLWALAGPLHALEARTLEQDRISLDTVARQESTNPNRNFHFKRAVISLWISGIISRLHRAGANNLDRVLMSHTRPASTKT